MKGMQKIKRGKGFRGVLEYCSDHDGGSVIGGNMSGTTPRELSSEFKISRQMRPDIDKPVWHNSLRLPAGEHLSDQQWQEIAQDYMRELGFKDDHQHCIFKHDSKEGEHIHIVASRVSLSGTVYLGKNENLQSTKLISKLESKHGLAITATAAESTASLSKRRLTKNEIDKAARTGWKPPKLQVTESIDAHISDARNLDDLTSKLAENNITVSVFVKDGIASGITFECEGLKFSGKSLGSDYKYQSIINRIGVNHEQNQQFAADANTHTTTSTVDVNGY
jgi:hypothetical protein